MLPKQEEYEPWEDGVRHKPTGIRVSLAYESEDGVWILNYLHGEPGGYHEMAVVQLAGSLLLN